MAFEKDTIAACATPPGVSALALVRVSGPQASAICAGLIGEPLPSRQPLARRLRLEKQVLDEVVITFWPGPRSYTGEDLVEISCHGNPLVVETILQALRKQGTRMARPGEFTERAFLHGRIDLTQAEAVLDVLQAGSERALLAAQRALAGQLKDRLMEIRSGLLDLLARIEAYIDFPEEDIQPEVGDGFRQEVGRLLQSIANLLSTAPLGHRLRSGYRLVLMGPPNVGKSSLLNALLGSDRAIVSPVPGTTRDTVEESIVLAGFPVRLIDTAGLRPTDDPVEQEGVQRTRTAAEQADLILGLVDRTQPRDPCESEWARFNGKLLKILTKSDLPGAYSGEGHPVSAKTGEGLEALRKAVAQRLTGNLFAPGSDEIAVNARHAEALQKATEGLATASSSLATCAPPELVASDLRLALQALESILGVGTSEDVLDRLFAQFCIGK
jgi:tRNA modification GTPase